MLGMRLPEECRLFISVSMELASGRMSLDVEQRLWYEVSSLEMFVGYKCKKIKTIIARLTWLATSNMTKCKVVLFYDYLY